MRAHEGSRAGEVRSARTEVLPIGRSGTLELAWVARRHAFGRSYGGRASVSRSGCPGSPIARCGNRAPYRKSLICRLSSVVEQRFCKPLVGSSNLSAGTNFNKRNQYLTVDVILVLRRSHAVVGCGTFAGLFAADLCRRPVQPARGAPGFVRFATSGHSSLLLPAQSGAPVRFRSAK